MDDRAVQEHEHDLRSLLGIGHANFGEQRGQLAEHFVLVRDNHGCCRVIVVGHVESGAHVRADAEASPVVIGTTRGAFEERQQPLASAAVRGVADQPRAVIEVAFRQGLGDELVLAGEVAIERHLSGTGPLRDRRGRSGVKTPKSDELRGGLEDALACVSGSCHCRTYDTLRSRTTID